jgi:hypothetical protein
MHGTYLAQPHSSTAVARTAAAQHAQQQHSTHSSSTARTAAAQHAQQQHSRSTARTAVRQEYCKHACSTAAQQQHSSTARQHGSTAALRHRNARMHDAPAYKRGLPRDRLFQSTTKIRWTCTACAEPCMPLGRTPPCAVLPTPPCISSHVAHLWVARLAAQTLCSAPYTHAVLHAAHSIALLYECDSIRLLMLRGPCICVAMSHREASAQASRRLFTSVLWAGTCCMWRGV